MKSTRIYSLIDSSEIQSVSYTIGLQQIQITNILFLVYINYHHLLCNLILGKIWTILSVFCVSK